MGEYKEIEGDLIKMTLEGKFDVICHSVNCFNVQQSGIAKQMVKHFNTNKFKKEGDKYEGDYNKLGQIDYEYQHYSNWDKKFEKYPDEGDMIPYSTYIVNCYTQFYYGNKFGIPVDYDALTLCMRKVNHRFKNKKIGLPGLISCGLAGGEPDRVKEILKKELKDCYVTVVYLKKD